jgi:hypothetical protein
VLSLSKGERDLSFVGGFVVGLASFVATMNMDGMRSALPAGPLLGLQADDDDEEIMAMDIPMMNTGVGHGGAAGGLGSMGVGGHVEENSHPRTSSAPRAVRRVPSA